MLLNGLFIRSLSKLIVFNKSNSNSNSKLKQNLNELNSSKAKMTFESTNGETIIDEECRDLRREVQLAKEKRNEEITEHSDAMLERRILQTHTHSRNQRQTKLFILIKLFFLKIN